jgi:hypothetical protein
VPHADYVNENGEAKTDGTKFTVKKKNKEYSVVIQANGQIDEGDIE